MPSITKTIDSLVKIIMKKIIVVFTCCQLLLSAAVFSQNNIFRIDSSNLVSTDNKNQNRYYKELPVTFKKGMGIVFYMEADAFKPYLIFFSSGDGKSFGTTHIKKEKGKDRMIVSFIAPADTSFFLIFSSNEENATGKFYYGYSILDSAQMAFSNDLSFCQKLGYLFNQWQLNWELLPTSVAHHYDYDEPEDSYDYRVTNNTLLKGSAMEIEYRYKEILFASKDFKASMESYNKICKDILDCLDANTWESKSEKIEEGTSAFSKKTKYSTHFFVKGSKGEPFKSFEIVLNPGLLAGIMDPYEVQLIFN